MDDIELLKSHLRDLARQANTENRYTFSNFLALPEQDIFIRLLPELPGKGHTLMGGSESAERQLAVFGDPSVIGEAPVPPVSVLSVTPDNEAFGETLSHRDYLGAILSLGIEREMIGDIIVRGKNAWFFAMDSVAEFLSENLHTVRHTTVTCRIAEGDIPELQPILEKLSVNVASERLDAVISALTGISRGHVTELFTRERVSVNGRVILKGSVNLKEGDILTVRGFGKYIYDGIGGKSKKGRLYVDLRKYV